MKKILLLFVLSFFLVSCDSQTTTEMTYPEMNYLSFNADFINDVGEQLNQQEDEYYIYFYGSTCIVCGSIKNEALYTIEHLKNDKVYFVTVDTASDIDSSIVTYVTEHESRLGTPLVVKIVDGELAEIYMGGDTVLEILHDLT